MMVNALSATPAGSAAPPARMAGSAAGSDLAPTELRLPVELRSELESLVEASYPYEACGVMIGRTGRRVVRVKDVFHALNLNVERARDRFLLAPDDHLAADRVARDRGLEIVGFWHSHPDHPARPSETDLKAAWEGYSYLIVSTPAFGTNDFRSWRLHGGQFLEEKIHHVDTEEKS